ncbi:MAG: hypothetical protein NTY22_08365 [Proteobacteria bacterium]|nr:hypothetical protein [Pseudomonadota bacterium]
MDRIKAAIEIVKKNYIPLMAIALAYSLLELGIMKVISPYMGSHSITSIFSGGVYIVIFALVIFELIRITFLTGFLPMVLAAVSGQEISISSFKGFLTKKRFFNVLILEIVVLPIFVAGLVLLIIPGVYWFVVTIVAYFIVVEHQEKGTLDSISASISSTKGYGWWIFLYICVFSMISFFASLIPVVSVITDTLLTPTLYVALALIYRECYKEND